MSKDKKSSLIELLEDLTTVRKEKKKNLNNKNEQQRSDYIEKTNDKQIPVIVSNNAHSHQGLQWSQSYPIPQICANEYMAYNNQNNFGTPGIQPSSNFNNLHSGFNPNFVPPLNPGMFTQNFMNNQQPVCPGIGFGPGMMPNSHLQSFNQNIPGSNLGVNNQENMPVPYVTMETNFNVPTPVPKPTFYHPYNPVVNAALPSNSFNYNAHPIPPAKEEIKKVNKKYPLQDSSQSPSQATSHPLRSSKKVTSKSYNIKHYSPPVGPRTPPLSGPRTPPMPGPHSSPMTPLTRRGPCTPPMKRGPRTPPYTSPLYSYGPRTPPIPVSPLHSSPSSPSFRNKSNKEVCTSSDEPDSDSDLSDIPKRSYSDYLRKFNDSPEHYKLNKKIYDSPEYKVSKKIDKSPQYNRFVKNQAKSHLLKKSDITIDKKMEKDELFPDDNQYSFDESFWKKSSAYFSNHYKTNSNKDGVNNLLHSSNIKSPKEKKIIKSDSKNAKASEDSDSEDSSSSSSDGSSDSESSSNEKSAHSDSEPFIKYSDYEELLNLEKKRMLMENKCLSIDEYDGADISNPLVDLPEDSSPLLYDLPDEDSPVTTLPLQEPEDKIYSSKPLKDKIISSPLLKESSPKVDSILLQSSTDIHKVTPSEIVKETKTPLIKRLGLTENKNKSSTMEIIGKYYENKLVSSPKEPKSIEKSKIHKPIRKLVIEENQHGKLTKVKLESFPETAKIKDNFEKPYYKGKTNKTWTQKPNQRKPFDKSYDKRNVKKSPNRIDLDSRIKIMFGMKNESPQKVGSVGEPATKYHFQNHPPLSRPPSPFRSKNLYLHWHRETYYFRKYNPIPPEGAVDPLQKRKIGIQITLQSSNTTDTKSKLSKFSGSHSINNFPKSLDTKLKDDKIAIKSQSFNVEQITKDINDVASLSEKNAMSISNTNEEKLIHTDVSISNTNEEKLINTDVSTSNTNKEKLINTDVTKVNVLPNSELELTSQSIDIESDTERGSTKVENKNDDQMLNLVVSKVIEELKISLKRKLTDDLLNKDFLFDDYSINSKISKMEK